MAIFISYLPLWKEAFILAWPVMLNHIFVTAMRTTDMILMGYFGPAAVTAVGLGDVWESIILRIGLGLGSGSISLISQESGTNTAAAKANKDLILSQVIFVSLIIGIPFIFIALFFAEQMIALLGAAPEVIELGAQYLMIIFAAAPFRIISIIAARALQGSGDTRTPMVVEVISNIINILVSVGLALGIGFLPEIGVPGVGIGTFTAKTLSAVIFILIFLSSKSEFNLKNPIKYWDFILIKQLFKVSAPKITEGLYQSLITFPFNSILLLFGTEVAAAYHIARRIFQQLIAPMHRSYYTVTAILSGQKIGAAKVEASKKTVEAMLILTLVSIGSFSLLIFLTSPYLVRLFGDNPETLQIAVRFLKALSIGGPLITIYGVLAGHLNGAGNTKSALYGNLLSQTLLKLGLSYLLGVFFDLGLLGILIALPADFFGRAIWVGRKYLSDDWIAEADLMISERRDQRSDT
ncbi:putative MATE family efflux protein [Halanaerobium saccharolyticum]|uniref:Probable multidrug resistance protein NorM n=1 Tax=Halanaerobium saccharolyticum TaxID=43595 RepID=A0A4R7Z581_9FIRM|nr:MATE family efflux transporter [Halanaerobium saccharolyticum]RAK09326.1 putative MATE family efflux protein [Halanaerobium saccharolyticum]TDW06185.1 putative MATE family efflux protein [Halanaerobium saccharolyticum]TDX60979.1 putative MATE family efflux protein [Halanaerobium saccharolyticum]